MPLWQEFGNLHATYMLVVDLALACLFFGGEFPRMIFEMAANRTIA